MKFICVHRKPYATGYVIYLILSYTFLSIMRCFEQHFIYFQNGILNSIRNNNYIFSAQACFDICILYSNVNLHAKQKTKSYRYFDVKIEYRFGLNGYHILYKVLKMAFALLFYLQYQNKIIASITYNSLLINTMFSVLYVRFPFFQNILMTVFAAYLMHFFKIKMLFEVFCLFVCKSNI